MSKRDPILDRPMLSLSESDQLCVRDLVEGTLITGAPGSGKSSTSGKQIGYGLLRTPNMGGLVLTAKAEETQNWIDYAKACGREKDLIVFNAESGHCFDPLHYEWTRPGRGAGDLESIIDFFSTLVSIGKKEVGPRPRSVLGARQRAADAQCHQAARSRRRAHLDREYRPRHQVASHAPGGARGAGVAGASPIARSSSSPSRRARKRSPQDQWSDLDFATQYIFRKWPAFDERPRSSLEMTWSRHGRQVPVQPVQPPVLRRQMHLHAGDDDA